MKNLLLVLVLLQRYKNYLAISRGQLLTLLNEYTSSREARLSIA